MVNLPAGRQVVKQDQLLIELESLVCGDFLTARIARSEGETQGLAQSDLQDANIY
jgi:hypothetical protein